MSIRIASYFIYHPSVHVDYGGCPVTTKYCTPRILKFDRTSCWMRVEDSCCRPRVQVNPLCFIGNHLLHRNSCFVANSVNFGLSLLIVENAEREYYNDWGSGKKMQENYLEKLDEGVQCLGRVHHLSVWEPRASWLNTNTYHTSKLRVYCFLCLLDTSCLYLQYIFDIQKNSPDQISSTSTCNEEV